MLSFSEPCVIPLSETYMMLVLAMHCAVLLEELRTTATLILVVAFLCRNSVSPLVRSYHLSSCLKQPFLISTNFIRPLFVLCHSSHNTFLRFMVIPLHHPLSACSPCAGLHHVPFFSTELTFPCPVSYLASLIIVVYSFEGTCTLPHNANLRAFSRTLKMRST